MSYTLHVWEAPAPGTVDEAYHFIFEQDKKGLRPSAKFPAFARALVARYPDREALAEAGEDQDLAIWVDGNIDGQTDSPVYVLGLTASRMDDDVLAFVANAAADHGLYVYDMQGDMLCRPDRTLMMRDGSVLGAPAVRPPSKAVRKAKPPRKGLRPAECSEILLRDIGAALAPHGWKPHLDKDIFRCGLVRQRGEIRQQLRFPIYGMTDNSSQPTAVFAFMAEPIGEAWMRALPEDDERPRRADPMHSDIEMDLRDLFPGPNELRPSADRNPTYLRSPQEAVAWAGAFDRWYSRTGGAALDACTDLPSLHRLLLTDRRLREGTDWTSYPMLRTLVLSHLVDATGSDFNVWLDAIRHSQQRDLGSFVEQYRANPLAFGGQVPWQVPQSQMIDRLVEALQRERATP